MTIPGGPLPDLILLDTSIVVTGFVAMGRSGAESAMRRARVTSLLAAIAAQRGLAVIAAATVTELVHLILRLRYAADLPTYPDPSTRRPLTSWTQVYKRHPGLVRTYSADIEALLLALATADILILQPADLGPLASGRRIEEELIRLVRRYRLDSADGAILIEARRAGIASVASEDPDWRRAARDFDVYTWI